MFKIFYLYLILAVILVSTPVAANSYVDMITTKPVGYDSYNESEDRNVVIIRDSAYVQPYNNSYDNAKYQAWLKSQSCCNNNNLYLNSEIQNVLYFVSGAFMLRFLYDVLGPHHTNHLIDKL